MSDAVPPDAQPPGPSSEAPSGRPLPPGGAEGRTPGGYAYTVVDDAAPPKPRRSVRLPSVEGAMLFRGLLGVSVLAALALIVFAVTQVRTGGGDGDVNAAVTNVLTTITFGQDQGDVRRFEGELPPGFPQDLPEYPGAEVVSSLVQTSGGDALYLAVWHTGDTRRDVADYFTRALDEDPWQLDAAQDGIDTTLHQFTRIDDANVAGVVAAAESEGGALTTIVVSMQIVSGADEARTDRPFVAGASKPLPEGFPSEVPAYPGATAIEALFQKQPGQTSFSLSFVTEDEPSDVLSFYREALEGQGLVVGDADAGASGIEDAEAIDFLDEETQLSGGVIVGTFERDSRLRRIRIEVRTLTSTGE
ncbi:MAG: hypothetical protein WEC75_05120 [Dehalococcoidia bacterium]